MPAVDFWKGEFGDRYTQRNNGADLDARVDLWWEILAGVHEEPKTILEVGANIGTNLKAIQEIVPDADLFACEPNDEARERLVESGFSANGSVAEKIAYKDECADLVFTSGVLIHITPEELLSACAEIYRCSKRWIVCVEYFSAEPRMVPYRGEDNRLWTRDFGSFYMDHFKLECRGCGFAWKRTTGLDNLTWWLFEKT